MRELGEMASQRRTYVWRTVFAALLLGLVYTYQLDQLRSYSSPLQVLGSGRWIFEMIIYWLGLAVFFGMPLLTCGCIVTERERNTLSLLLTTQVSPLSLVLQKLAARLYVMLTLVMVSVPLMALAYSMGGVTGGQIIAGVMSIVSLSVLTGSFGLMQSVRAASVVGALASTLIWMFVGSIFLGGFVFFGSLGSSLIGSAITFVIILSISVVFLQAAARRIPRAAIDPPRSRLLIAFRRADRFFRELNKGFGGIELTRDGTSLPEDEPLYWRERCKRALGRTHHLIRIVALLEIPTVLAVSLMILVAYDGGSRSTNPLSGFVSFLWIVAVLIVAVRTVGVWPLERSRETLDVLLTTPLSGRELVDQTMRGVRRTMIAVSVPILTVQLATAMIQTDWITPCVYLVGCAQTYFIILPLTAWGAMLISLRVRTQFRATVVIACALTAFIVVPRVFYDSAGDWDDGNGLDFLAIVAVIGQGVFVGGLNSTLEWTKGESIGWLLLMLIAGGACYVGLTVVLRSACAKYSDAWLGRIEYASPAIQRRPSTDGRCSRTLN